MRTDELIEVLGTNVEPVRSGQLRNMLFIALAAGGVAVVCLMLAVLGVPVQVLREQHIALKVVALAFTLGLVVAGASFLVRAARPGAHSRKPLIIIGSLFIAILSAGIATLLLTYPAAWGEMIFGPLWVACLFCIPLFAVAPFAALVWALRNGAPTSLARTGAVAGLVAGALGATVVALHHPGSSLPFIGLWYGGPIIICALAGAVLGPRLLRW